MLAPDRDDAQAKITFFASCGFRADRWQVLEDALREHAAAFGAEKTKQNQYGIYYAVEGALQTPAGEPTTRPIRSVWIIRNGETFPRFVSAYPIDE